MLLRARLCKCLHFAFTASGEQIIPGTCLAIHQSRLQDCSYPARPCTRKRPRLRSRDEAGAAGESDRTRTPRKRHESM